VTEGKTVRQWIGRYRQRLGYGFVAASLAAAVAASVIGGFRLHHAVLIERKTLHTQMLAQTTLELQNFALEAEAAGGVGPQLAAARRRALTAANAAFADLRARDPAEAGRLRAAYLAYVAVSDRAFADAARAGGHAPAALQRQAQRRLATLESLIGDEAARQAAASARVNPSARGALITAAVAAGLLVALLALLFEHERRAGRIDRDNASRAEELIRLRGEFVAVVSHELRTPLTSIMGYLELIADDGLESLTPDQRSYLAVVQRSAQRLGELVGDLLVVAEAERAPLTLELTDVDAAMLAGHAVEAARPAADARRIKLRLESDPGVSLRGDPTRLAQMLDNLVSNAIKFTPEGGDVTVRALAQDRQVLFEVADTGRGIAAAERTRLFEPFYRSRETTAGAVPGTGLGLTVTKAIVDAHRGTIQVDSRPNAGTTFRVRVPVLGANDA
jgi:signal transduction histidine kinase